MNIFNITLTDMAMETYKLIPSEEFWVANKMMIRNQSATLLAGDGVFNMVFNKK